MRFKEFLVEAPAGVIKTPIPSVDLTKSYDENNIATDYDWFYEYYLSNVVSKKEGQAWKRWRINHPKDYVNAFMWQVYTDTIKKQDSYEKLSLADLEDIHEDVTFSNGRVNYKSVLDMSEFAANFKAPPFKFGVVSELYLVENNLTEYEDWMPTEVVKLHLQHNNITSLHNLDKRLKKCKMITLTENPIKHAILSVLKIEGLQRIEFDDKKVSEIVNKMFLERNRRGWKAKNQGDDFNEHRTINSEILELQTALIDAGYDDLAEL